MQILKKLQKVSELDGCFDEEIGVIHIETEEETYLVAEF